MATILFDDTGTVWSPSSSEFAGTFIPMYTPKSASEYATENLGFVGIDSFGKSALIRLRPSMVSAPSVAAAIAHLQHFPYTRYSIAVFTDELRYEVFPSQAATSDRLRKIGGDAAARLKRAQLQRERPIGMSALKPPFASLYSEWSSARRSGHAFDANAAARRNLGGHFLIAQRGNDHTLVFDEIGQGLSHFGFGLTNAGRPVTEQRDQDYARWMTSSYDAVLHDNTPRLHDVDAITMSATGHRMRFRGQRFLLPILQPGCAPRIIDASIADHLVDLRQ
jgi:hypothetical protein